MKALVRKLFNIYPGEEKNALSFALLAYVWAFAVSLGWKNSDALFILNVGAEQLPTTYCIIALCMIVIASIMIRAYDRLQVHRIFLTNLCVGIVFYTIVHFFLKYELGSDSKVIWYALRIFGWIAFCVINTNFWVFIDQYYHLGDAKRLFSLFTSAIFLGFGTTGILMQIGLPEIQEVVLIIIAVLIAAIFLILWIVKKIPPIHGQQDFDPAVSSDEGSPKQLLIAVLKSKFTLCLMCLNFLNYVSVVLTEFNYMTAFQASFGGGFHSYLPNEETAPLTLFLGKCIAAASLFNIIFCLFFYSRLVRRFGLRNMLIITPFLFLTTYFGWQFSMALLFPLMGFFIAESSLLVVDDNNFNLLLNAVPSRLKYKVRVIIESFFEPIGTLTSALLLSFLAPNSKLLSLFFALLLLIMCLLVRKLYTKAIYLNLRQNVIHFEKTPKEWLQNLSEKEKKGAKSRLLELVSTEDPAALEFAIEGILDFEEQPLFDQFLEMLKTASPSAKLLFIEKLKSSDFANDPKVHEQLLEWNLSDNDLPLKGALHLFLAKMGLLSCQEALADLSCTDSKLVSASLIALKYSPDFKSAVATTELRALSLLHLKQLLESESEQDILMGLEVLAFDASSEDIHLLCPYLHHEFLGIARTAAGAIAKIASPENSSFSKELIQELTSRPDPELRRHLINALGKMADSSIVEELLLNSIHLRPSERRHIEKIIYNMGAWLIPSLLAMTKNTSLHDRTRVLAGKILGRLSVLDLRRELFDICQKEIDRAQNYFYHHHTIQESHPGHDLHVLKDALLSSYHSVLDFIIQLLGVAGEIEDVELLSLSMRSKNPKVRSQVVETLEKTCETPLFRLLRPLLEESPLAEKLKAASSHRLSLEQLLNRLQNSPLVVDQIAASAVLTATLNLNPLPDGV
jgi:hypothetical protein